MRRIISALLLAFAAHVAHAAQPLQLADDAPDRHTVTRGDTLWSLATRFLKEPYRWPEIWRYNRDQLKNPHRLYPGDILVLDRSGSTPMLKIAKAYTGSNRLSPQIYESPNTQAIAGIPINSIEAFLSRPLVVGAGELESSPRIIATQEDRVFLGAGDTAFVSGIEDDNVRAWQIYRPGKPLVDPETKEVLGLEAYYLGAGRLVQPGQAEQPAVIQLTMTKEEVGLGNYLLPAQEPDLTTYVPHRPEFDVNGGRVMTVYGGVNEGGKYSIITLNKGTMDNIEVGHVLALVRKRNANFKDKDGMQQNFQLPNERYGLVFVFRTFERLSYALILNTTRPVIVGDALVTP